MYNPSADVLGVFGPLCCQTQHIVFHKNSCDLKQAFLHAMMKLAAGGAVRKKCWAWLRRGAGFIHSPLLVSPAPCRLNPAGLVVQGTGAGRRAQAELHGAGAIPGARNSAGDLLPFKITRL